MDQGADGEGRRGVDSDEGDGSVAIAAREAVAVGADAALDEADVDGLDPRRVRRAVWWLVGLFVDELDGGYGYVLVVGGRRGYGLQTDSVLGRGRLRDSWAWRRRRWWWW